MNLVGLVALPRHRTFEVRNEVRQLRRDVIVVPHLIPRQRASASGLRARNTTKCESEKLTTKLTKIEMSLATTTPKPSQSNSSTNVAVAATMPVMPERTKVP